jgi:hypothetical protein
MLLWKAHNPWPGLRSALYDYWLDAGGGYSAALAVTQRPLHVQLNLATRSVEVVTAARAAAPRTVLSAQALRLNGSVAWRAAAELPPVPAGSTAVTALRVPEAPGGADMFFLRLLLLSPEQAGAAAPPPPPQQQQQPACLARNFYWQHAPGRDFSALEAWRTRGAAGVRLSLPQPPRVAGGEARATLRLANASPRVAFFIRLSLRRGDAPVSPPPPPHEPPVPPPPLWRAALRALRRALGLAPRGDVLVTTHAPPPPPADDRVLPVFWRDNYVSLLPGEAMDVRFAFALRDAAAPLRDPAAPLPKLRLEASGWNVPLVSLPLPPLDDARCCA